MRPAILCLYFFYLKFEFHNELPLKNEDPKISLEKQADLIHLLESEK